MKSTLLALTALALLSVNTLASNTVASDDALRAALPRKKSKARKKGEMPEKLQARKKSEMLEKLRALLEKKQEAAEAATTAPGAPSTGTADTSSAASEETESAVTNTIDYYERAGDNAPYPGIDSLGMGYNLVYGNPAGDPDTQMDPGFRAPVIELQWDQNYISRDQRFLQPVSGYAVPQQTCYMNKKATETSTSEEYSSNLETQCSVNGAGGYGPVSGSFSASAGYSSFQNSVASSSSKQFTITSYCLSYKAGFDYFGIANLKPTATLEEAIEVARNPDDCGTDGDDCAKLAGEGHCIKQELQERCKNACRVGTCRVEKCGDDSKGCGWFNLFDRFGTHFLSTVDLGGKMIYVSTISEESQYKAKDEGLSLASEVEASYMAYSGGASASMSSSSSEKSSKSSLDMETKIKVFGGIPPASGASTEEGFSEWADTVGDFPMAVRYDLTPISALAPLANIRAEVDTYITAYIQANKGSDYQSPLVGSTGVVKSVARKTSARKTTLYTEQTIMTGEKMYSPNGKTNLEIQDDGHLILRYDQKMLWTSNVYPGAARGPYKLIMQRDGNLVQYDKRGDAVWSSHTYQCRNISSKMMVQDDGNLVIYEKGTGSAGAPTWATMTHGPQQVHGHHNGHLICKKK